MFETNALTWFEDTETLTITREVETGTSVTSTIVYGGPGDFQPDTGATFKDAAGIVQVVDAVATVDPAADGTLPVVTITDNGPAYTVTVNGLRYDVVHAMAWTFYPPHLELHLKRGPQHLQQVG